MQISCITLSQMPWISTFIPELLLNYNNSYIIIHIMYKRTTNAKITAIVYVLCLSGTDDESLRGNTRILKYKVKWDIIPVAVFWSLLSLF